ncbi:DUF1285 domain-containing protein [Halomonas janggokensis]|jgi:hypothetical protein|uniref:DUF1285 domain-containing protein n=1 Tax=Vreelandella janggokensis TaxID=370767 RepID=A0ABT4ISZ6_9GAMM|nr:DUF1285 domain-containing protein [Halomonas janggokensis]MCZ0926787.1 DUF1285 domain-containing protein [Halomonas janggokensis]MCZ0929325.1 DUF1285 domain-containing protein [Halomonas janggokensis]
MNIDRLLDYRQGASSIPPLDDWQPALSGDMDIRIDAQGGWWHEGVPFARASVARLLSTLLRHDAEGYCLVTPIERWRIQVDDRPLVAVEADFRDDAWWLTTQFDDIVRLDAEHSLTLSETPQGDHVPEIAVRFGLAARLHRHVYYQLADVAELRDERAGRQALSVYSAGHWHPIGYLEGHELDGLSPSEGS